MTTALTTRQYEKYMKAALKYVCKSEVRPVLTGVYHHPDGSLIATDSHRLIRIIDAHEYQEGVLLDKKGLPIPGMYPDVSRVIPTKRQVEIDVNLNDWLVGHELADIIAKEHVEKVGRNKFCNHMCKLTLAKDQPITLFAENVTDGNMTHEFDITAPGNLTIHYNASFMIEAMKVLKSLGYKSCTISFNKPIEPMLVVAGNVTILLMPINPPQKK